MTASSARPRPFGDWLRWSPMAALNAFKTTLGLILAWGLALWLQWPDPFLAPIAVVFLQTPYLGASLRKGLLRVFGTLAGGIFVLMLLSWLIQDPWGLLAALSIVIGIAMYQIRASRYGYAWYMLAITAAIIAIEAFPRPDLAFQLAVYRTSEATLGILILLVINGVFWPQTGGSVYHKAVDEALTALANYLRALGAALRGQSGFLVPDIPGSLIGASVRLREILTAAALDSGGFRRLRRTYEAEIRALSALTGSLAAFAENLRLGTDGQHPVLGAIQRNKLAQALDSLAAIVEQCRRHRPDAGATRRADQRLRDIKLGLEQLSPARTPASHQGHSHALLRTTVAQCQAIAEQTGQLSAAAAALNAHQSLPRAALPAEIPRPLSVQLADNLPHAVVAVIAFWVFILLEFQWQWPPGGLLGVLMAIVIVGNDALNNLPAEKPERRLLLGAIAGTLLTAPLYLVIMPQLNGFLELALVLFPFYYVVVYFFHALAKPHSLLFTGFLLANLILIGLEPVQGYSLVDYANGAAAVLSGLIVGLLMLEILLGKPPSALFKQGLQQLLATIVASQQALAERARPDFVATMQKYEQRQREQLQSLARIAPVVADSKAPTNSRARIDAVMAAALRLSIQARALQQARARFLGLALNAQSTADGRRPQLQIGRRYRRIFQLLMRQISAYFDDPRVKIKLVALDHQRAWMLPELTRLHGSDCDSSNYRLTIAGYYIGVARALREFTAAVEAIDWAAWREPRF